VIPFGPRAVLRAIASYLPKDLLTNEDIFARYGEWSPEKISTKTGISTRHVCAADEFTSDLAVKAGERLFALDESFKEGIDQILLTTISPDYILPFTAGMVQDALGLPTTVAAFDITLGCSGYPYAMTQAAAMIESGRARKVLVITSDRFTGYTEAGGQDIRTLFGDAATASLIEAQDDGKPPLSGGLIGATRLGTDGSGALNLLIPTAGMKGFLGAQKRDIKQPTVEMKGPEVFDFTLRVIPKHVRSFLESEGLAVEDVDIWVFHQANLFMIDHLRRRMKIPEEKFVEHIAEVGNTASSTIPMALQAAIDAGRVKPGHRVALLGFGVGYSWGTVLLEYQG